MLKKLLIVVVTAIFAILFFVDGAYKLIAPGSDQAMFARYGFAPWFVIAFGLVEVLGALALLPQRLAPLAAALLALLMLGGAAVFAVHHDYPLAAVHLGFAIVLAALGLARRPRRAVAL